MNELPLLELFTRLREVGLPLDMRDYEALLQALQAGYGLPDRPALARLCRTLWVRSPNEQQVFDALFEDYLDRVELSPDPQPLQEAGDLRNWKRAGIYGLVGVGAISMGIAIAFWKNQPTQPVPPKPTSTAPASPTVSPTIATPTAIPLPVPVATPSPKPQSNRRWDWPRWSWLLVPVAGVGSFWLVRWGWRRYQQHRAMAAESNSAAISKAERPDPRLLEEAGDLKLLKSVTETSTRLAADLLRQTGDAVQVAQVVQQVVQPVTKTGQPRSSKRLLTRDYLPVTQRQLKQRWRQLRCLVREGTATELDIEATIAQVARQGWLLAPVLLPPRVNRTELLLLVDQEGSMVAFHSLAARFAETALRGSRLGSARVYYFHNCPVGYLYHDPLHLEEEPVDQVLKTLRPDRSRVLIISDAGAARGGCNGDRINRTQDFLQRLRPQVRSLVWLNPMPRSRWVGTTAGEIARLVPMVEATRQGLDQAIDGLRGGTDPRLLEEAGDLGGRP